MPPASLSLQSAFEQWLRSALDGLVDAEQLWAAAPRAGSAFEAVVKAFGLDAGEERILAAVWARHAGAVALQPAQLGRVFGATAAIAESRLGPKGRLVRHGLVEVTGAVSGRSPIELGRGLGGRLAGASYEWAQGATGIPTLQEDAAAAQRYADRFAVGPRLQDSLKFFVGHETRLAMISGASWRDAFALGAAVGRKLNRRVVVVEGWQLAGQSDRRAVLCAQKRDAELDGSVLVLAGALEVRDGWGVFAEALASAPARPLTVLLCDERELPFLAMPPGDEYLRLIEIRLGKPELTAVATATASAAPSAGLGELAPRPDPFAPYRQQAALDAERAMGPTASDIRQAASSAMRMPAPAKTMMPAAEPTALPPAEAPVAVAPSPAPIESPPPPVATSVAATPGVAPDDKKAKKGKKGKKAEKADEAVEAAPPPPPEPAAPPPPPAPPVEIPKNAPPRVLAQIAMTSPNPEQRIEIMTAIADMKDPAVVAAIRANVKSEHPGVRAAAEVVMARLFGPNWNQQRAIPKPVQPPRSDDDRGPPGGF